MKDKLYIVGSGPGSNSQLTDIAKLTIYDAKRVLCTRELPMKTIMSKLKDSANSGTVVLVSGDSGFFSLGKSIVSEFSDIYDIEVIPGISSIQYFCSKLKTSYDDAVIISLHGREGSIVPKVAYNKKVIALTGGDNSAQSICEKLCKHGLGNVIVSVGERLSYKEERIVVKKAADIIDMEFDALVVLCIENACAANPHRTLYDKDFERKNIPMTKEEVRWISTQKLGVCPQDIVFDIGAGSGSVSVELARKAFDGFVFAIEKREAACDLIRVNALMHGAHNIEIVEGEAPWAFDVLPVPDKAFIGGSCGNMGSIIENLISRNPSIRLVANAVTMQTVQEAIDSYRKHGIKNTDIVCVNIAKSMKTGGYDMMTAQNPVYIITGNGEA